ncbi:TPA: hypothetical protein ACH9VL_005248, partial [Escherichia coli]
YISRELLREHQYRKEQYHRLSALRAKSQRLGAMVSTDLSQGFCLLHPVSLWPSDNVFLPELYLFSYLL